MRELRVAFAQINPTVGDLRGNEATIAELLRRAKRTGVDLVLFPELAVTGYPPEDLLFKPAFIRANQDCLKRLIPLSQGLAAIIGYAERSPDGHLYNAAAMIAEGRLAGVYRKMKLPNYGVFDEKRYFVPGERPVVLELGKQRVKVGISICEDIWVENGPCQAEAAAGARLLINISASPYHAGKRRLREELLTRRARALKSWVLYINLVGGQDELIFDGDSMAASPSGRIVFRAPQFQEGLFVMDVPVTSGESSVGTNVSVLSVPWKPKKRARCVQRSARPLAADAEVFQALVLGTRDYIRKNRFSHVVVGLSGGIDSALVAAIAVAALGKESVTGVSMPSRYSSAETQADAEVLAQRLGIGFLEIPIEQIFTSILETLRSVFDDRPADVTEENLQARIRGTLLMALSNKFHWLVLATGNKSELSTGYCTLYGDMVGGFAMIKDVPKTWVYRISRYANRHFGRQIIPGSVFTRPPTAELRPNQRDQDVLPPYNRLDKIVRAYVEEDLSAAEIRRKVQAPSAEVDRVLKMIDTNEYKRRQAPIGIKITPRAFGRDRRMPITNRYGSA